MTLCMLKCTYSDCIGGPCRSVFNSETESSRPTRGLEFSYKGIYIYHEYSTASLSQVANIEPPIVSYSYTKSIGPKFCTVS